MTLRGAFHHTPRQTRTALAFLGSGAYPFERLITHQGAEAIQARHPTTGARLVLRLDEADRIEVVK